MADRVMAGLEAGMKAVPAVGMKAAGTRPAMGAGTQAAMGGQTKAAKGKIVAAEARKDMIPAGATGVSSFTRQARTATDG